MKMVGISSSVSGEEFGVYTSAIVELYSRRRLNLYGACVVIRCPTNESEYTAVDLQIAYNYTSRCRLRLVMSLLY